MSTPILRAVIGLVVALALSLHGLKKKSLSLSGSIAAFAVGFIHTAVSLRFGAILILFYYSSSYLTKVKQERKRMLEAHYRIGGQRNCVQVFSNSAMATIVTMLFWFYIGEDKNIDLQMFQYPISTSNTDQLSLLLSCMFVAHYACSTADTWASEVGILSTSRPRLAVSLFLRAVPHGTNGGMSLLGTVASFLGGAFIGLCYYLLSGLDFNQLPMILLGALCGVVGSLIDSILGGILQATFYSKDRKCIVESYEKSDPSIERICGWNVLSNDAVNVLSIAVTMFIGGYMGPFIFSLL